LAKTQATFALGLDRGPNVGVQKAHPPCVNNFHCTQVSLQFVLLRGEGLGVPLSNLNTIHETGSTAASNNRRWPSASVSTTISGNSASQNDVWLCASAECARLRGIDIAEQ
jgi:hypothetical protein